MVIEGLLAPKGRRRSNPQTASSTPDGLTPNVGRRYVVTPCMDGEAALDLLEERGYHSLSSYAMSGTEIAYGPTPQLRGPVPAGRGAAGLSDAWQDWLREPSCLVSRRLESRCLEPRLLQDVWYSLPTLEMLEDSGRCLASSWCTHRPAMVN
eukprot:1746363-Rhodomonas_salina.1